MINEENFTLHTKTSVHCSIHSRKLNRLILKRFFAKQWSVAQIYQHHRNNHFIARKYILDYVSNKFHEYKWCLFETFLLFDFFSLLKQSSWPRHFLIYLQKDEFFYVKNLFAISRSFFVCHKLHVYCFFFSRIDKIFQFNRSCQLYFCWTLHVIESRCLIKNKEERCWGRRYDSSKNCVLNCSKCNF